MWLKPAPLWGTQRVEQLQQPWLIEIASDNFLPEFLSAMATKASSNAVPSSAPPPVAPSKYLENHEAKAANANEPVKLFQPLHGRFYLVTASLVCRQLGLPDRTVDRKQGERTSFVLRRLVAKKDASGKDVQEEQAWVEGVGWMPVAKFAARTLLDKEEQFPLHPTLVSPSGVGEGLFEPDERRIYYGYIATGNREKYQDKVTDLLAPYKYRLSSIIETWLNLIKGMPASADVRQVSQALLLAMGDLLYDAIRTVWTAVKADNATGLSAPQSALLQTLNDFAFASFTLPASGAPLKIGAVLRQSDVIKQVEKNPFPPDPVTLSLDLTSVPAPDPNDATKFIKVKLTSNKLTDLEQKFLDALVVEKLPEAKTLILKSVVKPVPPDGKLESAFEMFVIRLVYEYDPDCPPVMSEQGPAFNFAEFFDPDAPPRMVRIVMPKMDGDSLKKYTKGVAMQFSPKLNKLLDSIDGKKALDGEFAAQSEPGTLDLTMICTFSIQIITLVALIVMFIFLFLLNIVFQWIAFLRICLPVPKKA